MALPTGTCVPASAKPPSASPTSAVDALYPSLESLYSELHQNPELSFQEEKTSATMAARFAALGFAVTTGVGGHGAVAVMKNGTGPTVMVRAELDALPIEEKTGLPIASKVVAKDAAGKWVPVMHACGHDVHMAIAVGAGTMLARERDRWHGTLMFVLEPAEEKGAGARAMLLDGLFTRFPRPDIAFAMHDSDDLAAGTVSYVPGYTLANTNTLEIIIHGRGGHGASPQLTVDPVVVAARTVVTLQTIVAREVDPRDPAVVTVGSIHGGTTSNVIPEDVSLQLTVRSFKPETQQRIVAAIQRIVRAECVAAGTPMEPTIVVNPGSLAVYNDPALTRRVAAALTAQLGDARVSEGIPALAGDDFSEYGRAGVPSLMLRLGAVDPQVLAAAKAAGTSTPSLHSPQFAPDRERTLKTGVLAMTLSLLELFGR